MVCSANELLEWKDFPKGLRVLLLFQDSIFADDLKSKLQHMDYIVTTFYDEDEAVTAVSSKSENFHVAIVEVSMGNSNGRFKFLESAKDIPTIMTSDIYCFNTMMKCIALGAVEFLQKPLSEEKLRNIWQHVVHKAFNTGESATSESLKQIKDFVGCVLQLQQGNTQITQDEDPQNARKGDQNEGDQSSNGSDKFPAPSTPQLIKQKSRSIEDNEYRDHDTGESKSVDTTHGNYVSDMEVDPPQASSEAPIKVEPDRDEMSKDVKKQGPTSHSGYGLKANKRKVKVDWTPELHKKFVQAVEQLGVDQAIPSRILELMKVQGLTRHNIASHLQKYRMHRRHILPKEDGRRWTHPSCSTTSMQRSYYPHPPVMHFPPYHTSHAGHVYPMWAPPSPTFQMWGPPRYPAWQSFDNWLWKPFPGMQQADAWGCPVMSPPQFPPSSSCPHVQNSFSSQGSDSYAKHTTNYPGEEEIDKVVKEAISKPWLPLPIGLKPPSTDSVLSELSRLGISSFDPSSTAHNWPRVSSDTTRSLSGCE